MEEESEVALVWTKSSVSPKPTTTDLPQRAEDEVFCLNPPSAEYAKSRLGSETAISPSESVLLVGVDVVGTTKALLAALEVLVEGVLKSSRWTERSKIRLPEVSTAFWAGDSRLYAFRSRWRLSLWGVLDWAEVSAANRRLAADSTIPHLRTSLIFIGVSSPGNGINFRPGKPQMLTSNCYRGSCRLRRTRSMASAGRTIGAEPRSAGDTRSRRSSQETKHREDPRPGRRFLGGCCNSLAAARRRGTPIAERCY